jgi:protein-L-isoaspartate(D-aspartate) O-methyltransferase
MAPLRTVTWAASTMLALSTASRAQDSAAARYEGRRLALVESLRLKGISDSTTLAAMRAVPRHLFVPADRREYAYEDHPLPIGYDATISQPYIVALMTQLVRPRPGMRVLEVGTGSGYQAAVLRAIGCRVWTIEIVRALADSARARLERLGYQGIEVRHGDGYLGWPERSPFDAILVTAAADSIPPALLEQLAPQGRLVMPVGDPAGVQFLELVERSAAGRLSRRRLEPVQFVPLLRGVR